MDIAARYEETKWVTELFEKFGAQGATAYATVAPELLDSLDAPDGRFLAAIDSALTALTGLAATPNTSAPLTARIDDLSREYAKRISRLVDVSALAADAYASLMQITGPAGQERIEELRAAGVSQRRIDALYPFAIEEHLPAIAQHALHGPQAEKIANLLRGADPMHAHNFFLPQSTTHISRAARDYVRTAYGPWESGVSSPYENVVDAWAYLLALMHGVAQQQRDAEGARTKLAKVMKQQCETVRELVNLTRTT